MSDLQRSVLKSRLPPFSPPSGKLSNDRKKNRITKDYTPTMWNEYFKERKEVKTEHGIFCVYLSNPPTEQGPILLLLHGGGFSALTWCHFSVEIASIIHCQCLAIDLRGHGDSETDDDTNLSAETMAVDLGNIINQLYPEGAPSILLIGHSMGGAIAVHTAYMEVIPSLIGVTVIDVVEGTAMEALASMQSFLRSRPTHFKSIPQAIEWSIRSGQIKNVDSAKVSMPGQIINVATGKLSTNDLPLENTSECTSPTKFANPFSIPEDAEESEDGDSEDGPSSPKMKPPPEMENPKKYTWRIDLSQSETFWPGWFQGLSEKFLNLRVPKLLLLANIDGLDRTLTIGQMQGKFQMQVLDRCGHAVHEDRPHEVAEVVGSYLIRNKFANAAGNFTRQMPSC